MLPKKLTALKIFILQLGQQFFSPDQYFRSRENNPDQLIKIATISTASKSLFLFLNPDSPKSPHRWGFEITLRRTYSVEILRTRKPPVAETSTWQHTRYSQERERDIYATGGFRTHNPASERPKDPLFSLTVNRTVLYAEQTIKTRNFHINGFLSLRINIKPAIRYSPLVDPSLLILEASRSQSGAPIQ